MKLANRVAVITGGGRGIGKAIVVATKMTGYSGSRPETMTEVFVYLASDDAKAVTGKMLSASGWKSPIK